MIYLAFGIEYEIKWLILYGFYEAVNAVKV